MGVADDDLDRLMFSSKGPDPVAAWLAVLMPWDVQPRHQLAYHYAMLRQEARLRAGKPISGTAYDQLSRWKAILDRDQLVIDYDPESKEGWRLTHRRQPFDHDLIREPD